MTKIFVCFGLIFGHVSVWSAPKKIKDEKYNITWGSHSGRSLVLQKEKIERYNVWTLSMWENSSKPRLLAKRVLPNGIAKSYQARFQSLAKMGQRVPASLCGRPWSFVGNENRKLTRRFACSEMASDTFKKKMASLSNDAMILLNLK